MPKRPAVIALILVALGGLIYFVGGLGRSGSDPDSEGDASAVADASGRGRSGGLVGTRGVIDPTAAEGRVTKAEDGAGVGGAIVVLTHNDDDDADPVMVRADTDGSWAAEDLSPGEYSVSATASGLLPAVLPRVELASGERRQAVDLQLAAGGSALRGTVRDIMGGPVEAALVRVTPVDGVASLRRDQGFSTATDENGAYLVQVPDGRHRVAAWHPDYAGAQRVIEFKAGDREQDFALTPMSIVEGTVISELDGKGVPGARVVWEREQMVTMPHGDRMAIPVELGTVTADGQGKFRIRGLSPGTIRLRATATGLGSSQPETVELGIAAAKTDVEVLIGRAFSIRGRVVTQGDQDAGIAGATVNAMAPGTRTPGVQSDAEGYFVMHGMLPGRYSLRANADGYSAAMQGQGVDVEGDVEELVIELDPGLAIRGRVEPPEATEVAIEMRPEDMDIAGGMMMMQPASTRSDAEDGSFELRPVRPGKTTVVARAADGRMGEVSLEVGENGAKEVVVTLEKRASVSGRVTDANGKPVGDASVSFRPKRKVDVQVSINGREMGTYAAPTDQDGHFSVSGLSAGAYEASVLDEKGDTLPWARPADPKAPSRPISHEIVGDADQTGLALAVEARDGVIDGVVKTADGEPAPEVWVTANLTPAAEPEPEKDEEGGGRSVMMFMSSDGMSSQSSPPVLTDEEGAFQITGLRSGEYELLADAKGGGARGNLEKVRPGQSVSVVLEPMGGIEGKVTINGRPAADFVVSVSGLSSRSRRVRDSSGAYEVDGLEAGSYRVSFSTPNGTKTENVMVEAGETATLDASLDELATVTGSVVDEEGQPIAGARILMGSGDGRSISLEMDGSEADVRTDEKGEFSTSCAAGKRVLIIMGPDMRPLANKPFVAKAGEKIELGQIVKQEMGGGTMMGGPSAGDREPEE